MERVTAPKQDYCWLARHDHVWEVGITLNSDPGGRCGLLCSARTRRVEPMFTTPTGHAGCGLAGWDLVIDSSQSQQRRALRRGHTGYARDVHALVAAIAPQDAREGAAARPPQLHCPVQPAAGQLQAVRAQCHAIKRADVVLQGASSRPSSLSFRPSTGPVCPLYGLQFRPVLAVHDPDRSGRWFTRA